MCSGYTGIFERPNIMVEAIMAGGCSSMAGRSMYLFFQASLTLIVVYLVASSSYSRSLMRSPRHRRRSGAHLRLSQQASSFH